MLPGEWAPELLDGILSSPNPEAERALYDAAFAAGRSILPQLQAALQDDRTAEFAAQCLAYMGGGEALKTLAGLISDPRDLDLRRFYFGALGEYRAPEATKILLYALGHADDEPDRTVTEAAILALTTRSDLSLIPQLVDIKAKIHDVVIRDDLDNAIEAIRRRAQYLASPAGQKVGGSIPEALRTYFIPALQGMAAPAPQPTIEGLTFSPDLSRSLAHVRLAGPGIVARYHIVLQKQGGNWHVVSVWLEPDMETPAPKAPAASRKSEFSPRRFRPPSF